jgi:hypothetical protein
VPDRVRAAVRCEAYSGTSGRSQRAPRRASAPRACRSSPRRPTQSLPAAWRRTAIQSVHAAKHFWREVNRADIPGSVERAHRLFCVKRELVRHPSTAKRTALIARLKAEIPKGVAQQRVAQQPPRMPGPEGQRSPAMASRSTVSVRTALPGSSSAEQRHITIHDGKSRPTSVASTLKGCGSDNRVAPIGSMEKGEHCPESCRLRPAKPQWLS